MSADASAAAFSVGEDTKPRVFHAIGPILIGLLAPMMVLFAIDPRALASASVLTHIYLGAIFLIATGAYVVSVFDPGEVTRVDFLKSERVLSIERTGLLAKKTVIVPFEDVASLRFETRYDDDGYKSDVPLIVLTTREVIELPAETTQVDIDAMRALLGRSGGR